MADETKPLSALAMAKQADAYACVEWTSDDVRQLRPDWSIPQARAFLEKHQAQVAHMMLEVGWHVLAVLIEQDEREVNDE